MYRKKAMGIKQIMVEHQIFFWYAWRRFMIVLWCIMICGVKSYSKIKQHKQEDITLIGGCLAIWKSKRFYSLSSMAQLSRMRLKPRFQQPQLANSSPLSRSILQIQFSFQWIDNCLFSAKTQKVWTARTQDDYNQTPDWERQRGWTKKMLLKHFIFQNISL